MKYALVALAAASAQLSFCTPTQNNIDAHTTIVIPPPAFTTPPAQIPTITCARTEVRHKGVGAWIVLSRHWPALIRVIVEDDSDDAKALKKHMNESGCKFLNKKNSVEHAHDLETEVAQQYFELQPKQNEGEFMSCIATFLAYVKAPTDLCEPQNLVPNPPIRGKDGLMHKTKNVAIIPENGSVALPTTFATVAAPTVTRSAPAPTTTTTGVDVASKGMSAPISSSVVPNKQALHPENHARAVDIPPEEAAAPSPSLPPIPGMENLHLELNDESYKGTIERVP